MLKYIISIVSLINSIVFLEIIIGESDRLKFNNRLIFSVSFKDIDGG
jgi:hypothetical protein